MYVPSEIFLGLIPRWVKPKIIQIGIDSFLRFTLKIEKNSMKLPQCVVGRWQFESKTKRSISAAFGLVNLVNKFKQTKYYILRFWWC